MYQVIFKPRAEKFLSKLDKKTQQRITDEVEKLAENPFTKSNIKKIAGTEYGYRLRIMRYRVLFSLYAGKKLIDVIDIFMEKSKQDYALRRGLFIF